MKLTKNSLLIGLIIGTSMLSACNSGSSTLSSDDSTTTSFKFSAYKQTNAALQTNNVMGSNVTGVVTPLTQLISSTPMNTITWAFATGECGQENWYGLSGNQFASANIPVFQQSGLGYIVSTGGAGGAFTCSSSVGMDAFLTRYMSPNLVGLDFDIEGNQINESQIQALINSISYAQQRYPSLPISFTLATQGSLPQNGANYGNSVISEGQMVIQMAQAAGLRFNVNLMAMDYGTPSANVCVINESGDCDMVATSEQAAINLHNQFNIPYANIELTPMIGLNDTPGEYVTLTNATALAQWVSNQGLGGLHYWSFDRDTPCSGTSASWDCSGAVGSTELQTQPLQYLQSFASGLNLN